MKLTIIFRFFIAILFCNLGVSAQPYTLDKNIKPLKLELTESKTHEGAKFAEANFELFNGDSNYHFVKGHDVFEYVDIFIYAHSENPNIKADLVLNTWNSIEETQYTAKAKNGIINFKVRSWQDIGFTVSSDEKKSIKYGVVVNASEPIMEYLGSPFVKATETQIKSGKPNMEDSVVNPSTNNGFSIPWWGYAIIGILVLLVGFLGGRLINSNKNKSLFLVLLMSAFTIQVNAQEDELTRQGNEHRERRENNQNNEERRQHIDNMINFANNTLTNVQATTDAAQELMLQYRGLGSCLNSGRPPGQPTIPSFCAGEESDCADCFARARASFNRSRYNLEKLQTIYDCSKAYIDAAVAFGDNVSGYHGVVGLVWQAERRQIISSVDDLNKAYDKKRVEMLMSFHESLMELNDCENEHGMPDWYDRFGVMFFNFTEMRYHR